jgi:DedD protein
MNKHRIVGFIVLSALVVIGVQFFLTYQKTNHSLQAYRSPPIAPLSAKLTSPNNAPSIQSAEAVMERNFDNAPDVVPAVPAWIVQIASLSNESAAQTLLTQLKSLGFDAFIFPFTLQDKQSFRVCAGPFTEQSLAITALSTIQERLKITGILKQYIPGDVKEANSQ